MKVVKTVVGILRNQSGQLLIAKRQAHQFKAGFWELPGGKVEVEESEEQAIIRELQEELGVQVTQLSFHQNRVYDYADRRVELRIYNIDAYQNVPKGVEGQEIAWAAVDELGNYKLLPTMKAFIDSITLPNKYWITPAEQHQSQAWTDKFEQKLTEDIGLIQLRSKTALSEDFIMQLYNKCQQHKVKLLLNTINKTFKEPYCDGWHITTNELLKFNLRPCVDDKLLGASTHNLEETLQAQNINVDFIALSPIQATPTHPDATPLGWETAKILVNKINVPVYFLGGMAMQDLDKSLKLGAQGIAGVRAF